MRRVVLAVLTVGLLFGVGATGNAGEKAGKKDEERLQGTWSVVSGEKSGEKAPEDEIKDVTITFDAGGKVMVKGLKGNQEFEGSYKLNPSKKPREVDLTLNIAGKEEALKGIYLLEKDSLKLCVAAPPGERPTEFATAAGSNSMLIVLKREER
jgi:uncharacterized protein (TIGR03067 family)